MTVRTRRVCTLMLALTLLGCGAEDAAPAVDAAPPREARMETEEQVAEGSDRVPNAEMRSDLMRLEPPQARPGDGVALRFPDETTRGVGYVLERSMGGNWRYLYALSASPAEGFTAPAEWAPADDPHFGWPDIPIDGPGPDHIVVPDTAEAGEYRLCTESAPGRNFCAALTIVD